MPFTFNLICQECLISVMLRIFVDCACYSTLDVLTLFKDTFISSLDYCSIFTHLSASTLGFPVSVQQNKWVKSLLFWGRVSSSLGQHQAPYVAQYSIALNFRSSCFHQGLQNMLLSPDLYRNQINLGLPVIKTGYQLSTSPARNLSQILSYRMGEDICKTYIW